jgi:hypothetical protein
LSEQKGDRPTSNLQPQKEQEPKGSSAKRRVWGAEEFM